MFFPTRSLRFASRRTQMAPPHFLQLLGKRMHASLTPLGIVGVSEFRKLWGKKGISSSTFVCHVDFRDEGAFSRDCFVSEVFDHHILGTRLERFHDSARLPVSPFVDDSRLLGRSYQFQSQCFCSSRLSSRHSSTLLYVEP